MLVHKECRTYRLIEVVESDAYNKRKRKRIVNAEPTINSDCNFPLQCTPWEEWQFRWWECTIPCRSMKGQHRQWIEKRASQNRQEWCHSKVNGWWMAKDLLHCPQVPSPASNHIHLGNFEWVLAFASTVHRTWNQPLTPTQCKIIAAYRT